MLEFGKNMKIGYNFESFWVLWIYVKKIKLQFGTFFSVNTKNNMEPEGFMADHFLYPSFFEKVFMNFFNIGFLFRFWL